MPEESRWTKGSTHTLSLQNPEMNGSALTLTSYTVLVHVYYPSGTQLTGSPFTVTPASATLAEKVIDNSLVTEEGTYIVIWKLIDGSSEPYFSEEQEVEVYPNRAA